MRAFKFVEELLEHVWPKSTADRPEPDIDPPLPQPTDVIGKCAECRLLVLRCDGTHDDDRLVHVDCLAQLYGGRANRARMQLVWETIARPFDQAFGRGIRPSLETLLLKGVDAETANRYLDSLDYKLERTSCMDSTKRTNAKNALRAARQLLA